MRSKNLIIPLMCLLFTLCLEMPLFSSSAQNIGVEKGDLSIVEHKKVTQFNASENAVVSCDCFEVASQNEVKIVQPSPESTLVIVSKSNQPSRIKGKLSANGNVYIYNPNGIYIDKEATVEKGSFYFIGAELNKDEPSQDYNHLTTTGDVINHGCINSHGYIHLIGRHVVNSGLITADEQVVITKTNAKDQLSILHTGTIRSKDILMEAQEGSCEVYGIINAKNTVEDQYGGKICILGQNVRLIGAYLDASGTFRGGQINIGGDLEGKGDLFKATRTSVDDQSILDASAIEYGEGGQVILWSQELTSFQGEIFARGGRKFGAGGLVETSSSNHLGIFSGKVNVDASCGEAGQWILDPSNIVITDSDDASTDLSLATEYPPQSGSQVTIHVDALNQFAGGKLELSASNRITVDANIENISSTLELTLRAGNQIRLKNEHVHVPNGKISFIVENQESGQIICSKGFKEFTAHKLVIDAPYGENNGLQVETNSLVLNLTNSNRSEPEFIFNTDVFGVHNHQHYLYLKRARAQIGSVNFNGALSGFDFVNAETHLAVEGKTCVAHLVTKGATKVQLLGGGEISELVEFDNLRGIVLGGSANSHLFVNGNLNTSASQTVLCGKIEVTGDFELGDVKLSGNTVIDTHNNPLVVHQNISQENALANLVINTQEAQATVEGSIYVNNFEINSNVAPAFCGELCVLNFDANTPEIAFAHDLIVSGMINCRNLSTNGQNKKVAFARGGHFEGETSFSHTGTTTLGDDEAASFHFASALDTRQSITYTHGLVYVAGEIQLCDLFLLGDTSLQCTEHTCNISGFIQQQEGNAHLDINTQNSDITIGRFVEVHGLSLNTTHSLEVNVPVYVSNFFTSSPDIEFADHLFVSNKLTSNNIRTYGENSQLSILQSAEIKGYANFENGGETTFGKSEQSCFLINNKFSCLNAEANMQGQFDVVGAVEMQQIAMDNHLSFVTHGHDFKVQNAILQKGKSYDLSVATETGDIHFGQSINVQNLSLQTSSAVHIDSLVNATNINSSSPLLTFSNNVLIEGEITANSLATIGQDKKFQLNHGGRLHGDAKLAHGGLLIVGQSDKDIFEVSGPVDRSNGETIAQGTIRSHGEKINFDKLSLSGALTVLSMSNDGSGAPITFYQEVDGCHALTVNAGSSSIEINRNIGSENALSSFIVFGSQMDTKADIFVERGVVEFYTNIYLSNNVTIENLGRGGIYFFGTLDGSYDLNAIASNLIVVKKDIGLQTALNAVNFDAKRVDVWASISANSGAINFNADVEICENIKMVNTGRTGICFNGCVDGDHFVHLRLTDPSGKVSFNQDVGSHQSLRHLVLSTSAPVSFNHKVCVDHFETTAPLSKFYNDVLVSGQFNVRNVEFSGARQNVSLLGGGQILGNATFNNKGDLTLGLDDQSTFDFQGVFSRIDGPTYARGTLYTNGPLVDFSALHAVGNLNLISTNSEGTVFNFNSTIDGNHEILVESKSGSVNFFDYVGNQKSLASLAVHSPTIAMQREIKIRDQNLILNGNLTLLNHSSLVNQAGEQILVSGTVNGEWDLKITAPSDGAKVAIGGAIGNTNPINHLCIDMQNRIDFSEPVSAYNIQSSAPVTAFNHNMEVKKQLSAKNVIMTAKEGMFTVSGGADLSGNLELNNTCGHTVLGDSQFSSFTTGGACTILSENTYAQGSVASNCQPIAFNQLKLNGPLKVMSRAKKSLGSSISFNQSISGGHALEVDAGDSSANFADEIGAELALQSLNIQAATINLSGNVSVGEGATTFAGNIFLNQDIKISDNGKGVISFSGFIDGPFSLGVINQNSEGSISFNSSIGSKAPLANLAMTTQSSVDFPKSVEVAILNTTSPLVTLADDATVSKEINAHGLVTKGKYKSVRFLGKANFSGMTTFSNTGTLVLGSEEDSEFNFSGPLSVQNCVLISKGNVNAKGAVYLKELSLKGATTFNTSGHEFNVKGIVEPLSDQSDLTIEAGAGQVTFGNQVTAHNLKFNTALPVQFNHAVYVENFETKSPHVLFAHNVTINGHIAASDITAVGLENKVKLLGGGEIRGSSVFKNGRGLVLGGSDQAVITFHGPLDTTTSLLETRGTIETVNKTIDIGAISVVGNTTIRSTSKESEGKNIYFLGAVEGPRQLRANAGKAKVCFENHVGSKTALESLQATGSKIEMDGDVIAHDGNVVFAGDVVFTNTSNLTANGNANIIFQGTVNVDSNAKGPVNLILDTTGKIEFQKDVGDHCAFNEVIVSRAGELVCRSPLKSNIIQSKSAKPFQKIEAKAKSEEEVDQQKEADSTKISKSGIIENVHQSEN